MSRLRAELEAAERERIQLRAQLDSAAEQLESAQQRARRPRTSATAERTQAMPPPTTAAGGAPRRFDRPDRDEQLEAQIDRRRGRRPAERTAQRVPGPPARSRPAIGEKLTGWVGSVMGSRDDESSKNGESHPPERPRAKDPAAIPAPARSSAQPAARPSRSGARRTTFAPQRREQPSWPLRVAAIGLLALMLIALLVIVTSIA